VAEGRERRRDDGKADCKKHARPYCGRPDHGTCEILCHNVDNNNRNAMIIFAEPWGTDQRRKRCSIWQNRGLAFLSGWIERNESNPIHRLARPSILRFGVWLSWTSVKRPLLHLLGALNGVKEHIRSFALFQNSSSLRCFGRIVNHPSPPTEGPASNTLTLRAGPRCAIFLHGTW